MQKKNTLWYVRHAGETSGPFPTRVITHNLTLGRLSMEDEISHDRVDWRPLQDMTELHPDDNIDINTNVTLDERDGFDRRRTQEGDQQRHPRSGDRRAPESEEVIKRRQFHTVLMQKFREQQSPIFWPLAMVAVFLISITTTAIISPTLLPVSQADCQAPADIAVNWNNCLKPNIQLTDATMNNAQLRSTRLPQANLLNATLTSADMAYADLRQSTLAYSQLQNVNLVGADLQQADLSNADLSNADLSYANLQDANLQGAVLDNVSLDNAIWINGDVCGSQSVGRCIRSRP